MKRIHFPLGRLLIKIEVSSQDTVLSKVQPLNHRLRLSQIEEERRNLMLRY